MAANKQSIYSAYFLLTVVKLLLRPRRGAPGKSISSLPVLGNCRSNAS